jgi:hypothetical protein
MPPANLQEMLQQIPCVPADVLFPSCTCLQAVPDSIARFLSLAAGQVFAKTAILGISCAKTGAF